MKIRFASLDDARALSKIYAQYIDLPISFECAAPSAEEFRRRIADIGAFHNAEFKGGRWHDVEYFEKQIGAYAAPPREPVPAAQMPAGVFQKIVSKHVDGIVLG